MLEYFQANKKPIIIGVLGTLFIGSTLFSSLYSPSTSKNKPTVDLVSILSKTTQEKTGLQDIPEGETLPNWKIAVMEKAALDDPSIDTTQALQVNTENLDNPNNITAQYAKNVYAATAILGQQTELTNEQKEEIAKALFEEEAYKAAARVYTSSDIKTTTGTKDVVKKYGNTLGGIVMNATIAMAQVEDIPTFEKYATTRAQDQLDAINLKIATVTKYRDDVLKLPAPKSATLFHLNLINAIESYRQTLINMRSVHTDALRATIGAHDYAVVVKNVYISADFFSQYFTSEGVVFGPKEDGAFFSGFLLTPQTP